MKSSILKLGVGCLLAIRRSRAACSRILSELSACSRFIGVRRCLRFAASELPVRLGPVAPYHLNW